MKKIIALLSLFACVCIVGVAYGGGHCTIRQSAVYNGYAQTYAQATYVEPVVVVQYVAVPLAVPTFSITYGAYGGVPGQPAAADSDVAKLRADVEALGQKVDRVAQFIIQQPPPKDTLLPKDAPKSDPPSLPKADPVKAGASVKARPELAKHPGVGVLNKSCASCHEQAKAGEFGGGVVLSSGKDFASISAETSKAAVRALLHGKMPKGAPRLSDDDSTQLIDLFTQP